jgi:hypothetical protein
MSMNNVDIELKRVRAIDEGGEEDKTRCDVNKCKLATLVTSMNTRTLAAANL